MLTDNDLEKMKAVFVTKDDLKNLATKEDVRALHSDVKADVQALRSDVKDTRADVAVIRTDLANLETKADGIVEDLNALSNRVGRIMTREEASALFDMATLKVEHNHIKEIIEEKLHVKV